MKARERTLGSHRGYTAVELLMAVGVFMIGVVGIVSMQRVAIATNQESKSLQLASRIAESWLDELTAESAQWNDTGDFNETDWLINVGPQGSAAAWFRPAYVGARNWGAGFNALGDPVTEVNLAAEAHFCTHLRLTWLEGQARTVAGNGLIRAEVRVFWRRSGNSGTVLAPLAHICSITPNTFAASGGEERYHVINLSTTLRQHQAL